MRELANRLVVRPNHLVDVFAGSSYETEHGDGEELAK